MGSQKAFSPKKILSEKPEHFATLLSNFGLKEARNIKILIKPAKNRKSSR